MDPGPLLLFGLGFAVGLSGALMPGPLLVYTIRESLDRGKWTGFRVILGHALVEVAIFLLLVYGLLQVLSDEVISIFSILGGAALVLMGLHGFYSIRPEEDKVIIKEVKRTERKIKSLGVFGGGIVFTALNPGFPVWWMTVGTSLLLEGYKTMGLAGMLLVLTGHWAADFGWYTLVSMTVSKSSRRLLRNRWYNVTRGILSGLLAVLGCFFLAQAAFP